MGKPAASRADAVFPSTSGPRLWSALTRRRVVLLAGSAPEAAALADVDLDGLVRVAINNAWRIRSDFDYVVFPRNFPDENRPPQDYPADLVRERLEPEPLVGRREGGAQAVAGAFAVLEGKEGVDRLL